jgi:hypothetical protein
MDRKLGGTHSWSGHWGYKGKILYLCLWSKPGRPVCSNTLYWLSTPAPLQHLVRYLYIHMCLYVYEYIWNVQTYFSGEKTFVIYLNINLSHTQIWKCCCTYEPYEGRWDQCIGTGRQWYMGSKYVSCFNLYVLTFLWLRVWVMSVSGVGARGDPCTTTISWSVVLWRKSKSTTQPCAMERWGYSVQFSHRAQT